MANIRTDVSLSSTSSTSSSSPREHCSICSKRYHTLNRRKQCEVCLNIFCSKCCKKRSNYHITRHNSTNTNHMNERNGSNEANGTNGTNETNETNESTANNKPQHICSNCLLHCTPITPSTINANGNDHAHGSHERTLSRPTSFSNLISSAISSTCDSITKKSRFRLPVHSLKHREERQKEEKEREGKDAENQLNKQKCITLTNVISKPTKPQKLMAPEGTTYETIDEHHNQEEQCGICHEKLNKGRAMLITECAHHFHWNCLKTFQLNQKTAVRSVCPVCHAAIEDLHVVKVCDHPRVRLNHQYCRDCGMKVSEKDVKPRADEGDNRTRATSTVGAASSEVYQSGPQGAIVRCPTCRVQLRVLPHMYNMRVACPAGHQFQVAIAPENGPALGAGAGAATGTTNEAALSGNTNTDRPRNSSQQYPGMMSR